jgi:hypothetical protein
VPEKMSGQAVRIRADALSGFAVTKNDGGGTVVGWSDAVERFMTFSVRRARSL